MTSGKAGGAPKDGSGLQPSSTWPIPSISISSEDVSYQYAGGSSLKTQMVDSSGTSQYVYDTRGRLSIYTPPQPANYEVDYTYNAANEKTSVIVKHNGADAYQTLYTYFKDGWLKRVKGQAWVAGAWSDMTQVNFVYDAAGNRIGRKNNASSDMDTTYAVNARGETASITHSKTSTLYKLVYTRDGLGNPLQVTFSGSQFSQPYSGADTVRYSYDNISRLTVEDWGAVDWSSANSVSWTYDWMGNRGIVTDYNPVDEYLRDSGYKYDYLGNTEYAPNDTDSTRTRYYYSRANLLSQVDDVTSGGTTSTYVTWDASRQRVKLARGSDTWEMIYDPSASIPAVLLMKNYVSSTTSYVYNVREPGGLLMCNFDTSTAPNKYYYHFDSLGSTVLVTDGTGASVSSYTYGSWGKVLATSGADLRPYQYAGRLGYYAHDSEQSIALANLLQLGVRFYDPESGRFTQKDMLLDEQVSAYAYSSDKPTRRADPTGLKTVKECHSDCYKRYYKKRDAIDEEYKWETIVGCPLACAPLWEFGQVYTACVVVCEALLMYDQKKKHSANLDELKGCKRQCEHCPNIPPRIPGELGPCVRCR